MYFKRIIPNTKIAMTAPNDAHDTAKRYVAAAPLEHCKAGVFSRLNRESQENKQASTKAIDIVT